MQSAIVAIKQIKKRDEISVCSQNKMVHQSSRAHFRGTEKVSMIEKSTHTTKFNYFLFCSICWVFITTIIKFALVILFRLNLRRIQLNSGILWLCDALIVVCCMYFDFTLSICSFQLVFFNSLHILHMFQASLCKCARRCVGEMSTLYICIIEWNAVPTKIG